MIVPKVFKSPEFGQAKVYQGDNLKVMPYLEGSSINAVVTDPPYGTTEEGKAKMSGDKAFGHEWDRELPTAWLSEAARILKPGGAIIAWTDTKRTGDLWKAMEAVDLKPLQCIFWRVTNPAPNLRKNFCSAVQAAVFGRKPGKVLCWNGKGFEHNIFEGPKVHLPVHPTQKPVTLMQWCVRLVTKDGDTILDPFSGYGTTLIACIKLNCNSIGIELDSQHAEQSWKRIDAELRQGRMF